MCLGSAEPSAIQSADASLTRCHAAGRGAQKQRPGHAPGRVQLAEVRLLAFQLGRLSPLAVNVALDYRVPARRQQVRHLVAHVTVGQRQATRQDHIVGVVVLPQPRNDFGHQLQHAAGPLGAVDGRPVFVQPVEHLGSKPLTARVVGVIVPEREQLGAVVEGGQVVSYLAIP